MAQTRPGQPRQQGNILQRAAVFALPYWMVALANAREKEFIGKKTANRER